MLVGIDVMLYVDTLVSLVVFWVDISSLAKCSVL